MRFLRVHSEKMVTERTLFNLLLSLERTIQLISANEI